MISAGKAKTMFNVHKHAHSRTLILNMRIPQPYRRLWPVPGLEGGSRSSRTHRGQRAAGSGHSQPAGRSISYHLKRLPENEGVGKTVLVVPREGTRRHGSRHRRLPRGQRFRPTDRTTTLGQGQDLDPLPSPQPRSGGGAEEYYLTPHRPHPRLVGSGLVV